MAKMKATGIGAFAPAAAPQGEIRRPGRRGKAAEETAPAAKDERKGIMLRVSDEQSHRMKQACLDLGITLQEAGLQGWNLLFREHGLPPLDAAIADRFDGKGKR